MSYEIRNLERIRVYEEPNGSFATDHSGTLGDFLDLHFQEGSSTQTRTQEMLDPRTAKQRIDDVDEQILGRKRCTLGLTSVLASHGTGIDGDTTPPTNADWGMARMMKAIMGGEQTQTPEASGTTVASVSSNSQFDVTAGHGDRFLAGTGIALVISGKLECRVVESVSTDTITVKHEFSGTPTGTVYGSVTHYLTEDPNTSLQFVVEGAETEDRYVLQGLQGGFTLGIEPGQLPTIAFNLNGATWTKMGSGSLSNVTHSNFSPAGVVDSEFIVGTVGTAAGNIVHVQTTSWEPAIVYTELGSTSGTQNIVRYRRSRADGGILAGSFTPFRDSSDLDWESYRDSKTDLALFQQIGSAAGSAVLLEAPTVQILDVQDGDNNGVDAFNVNWRARLDTEIAGSTTLGYSAFRVHWF